MKLFNSLSDLQQKPTTFITLNYESHILGVSVRGASNISTEVKLDALFRVYVQDGEGFEKFLSDFSQRSGTSYNKKNQCDYIFCVLDIFATFSPTEKFDKYYDWHSTLPVMLVKFIDGFSILNNKMYLTKFPRR